MDPHHLKTPAALLQELGTDPALGLTQAEAAARLERSGPNELAAPGLSAWVQAARAFTDGMFLLLAGGASAAFFAGMWGVGLALTAGALLYFIPGLAAALLNRPSIAGLVRLLPTEARVLREGQWRGIEARDLVPGDLVQVEEGHALPADLRFIEAVNLRVQEGAFTGLADPVEKQAEALSGADLPLAERRNVSYMGALVTQGRGLALVTETGMQTRLGMIASAVQAEKPRPSPLQQRIGRLRKALYLLAGASVAWLVAVGALTGLDGRIIALLGISLAAGLVPAALPSVSVLALALAGRHMQKRGARPRGLGAVETLGAVTVIASDKTGTLTENRMTVVAMDVAGHALDLTGALDRRGSITSARRLEVPAESALSLTAIGGALCSDASLIDIDEDSFHTLGDPTEGALVTAAARLGYWKSSLEVSFPRVAELPFDPERKRMTTVHDLIQYDPTILSGLDIGVHRYIAFTKGGVDGLLALASHVWVDGAPLEMDAEMRERIEASAARLAGRGMRVLGVAFRLLDQIPGFLQTDLEQNLTFLGLFGMVDPPRPEVPAALELTRAAGVRTLMLTTDLPLTAVEIARRLGIMDAQATRPALKQVLTGAEVDALPEADLVQAVGGARVFVRLSPLQKLKLVKALQSGGQVAAMTGNDVMDASFLRQADVGVSMGLTGTEPARDAADLAIQDDSFAGFAAALEEGRLALANLDAYLQLLGAGIIARVLVLMGGVLLPGQVSLLPLQMLWLGLLVDGLLGIGLALGRTGSHLMQSPPEPASAGLRPSALWTGTLAGLLGLGVGAWAASAGLTPWQNVVFAFLAAVQVGQVWVRPLRSRNTVALALVSALALILLAAGLLLPGW